MVSFKKVLTIGAFLIASIAAIPVSDLENLDTTISGPETEVRNIDISSSTLETRQNGHQLLHWSPDGTLVYLIGTSLGGIYGALPPELQNMVTQFSQGTPGQVLLANFKDFLNNVAMSNPIYGLNYELLFSDSVAHTVTVGAVSGVSGAARDAWGFAFKFGAGHIPAAGDLAWYIQQVQAFAQQDGGLINVFQVANGFFDPARIGAGPAPTRRTRNDNCPALSDLLPYAVTDVPQDIDYNTDLRWSEPCPTTS